MSGSFEAFPPGNRKYSSTSVARETDTTYFRLTTLQRRFNMLSAAEKLQQTLQHRGTIWNVKVVLFFIYILYLYKICHLYFQPVKDFLQIYNVTFVRLYR